MREAPRRVVYKQKEDRYAVGEKIRRRREELKMSQDELADILGSTRNMVYKYEKGQLEMGITTFIQYCDALNMDPKMLLPSRTNEEQKESGKTRLRNCK